MKIIKFVFAMCLGLLMSCGGSKSTEATEKGFVKLEQMLKDQFGEKAYYTELSITPIEALGNVITLTVTEDPESLKMTQWNNAQGSWNKVADVALSIDGGAKAADFMFQLDESINLKTLGALIEKSQAQLKKEHNLDHTKVDIAYINFPKNGDKENVQYVMKLKPEHGGTSFDFFYDLKGQLIK